ncbi:A disintegrin and metalloproteinase with thrombospondin motifs 2 [Oryzias melastigma]|uniref:A disintegrin and metalloproteinase with thrombospondin motifs 2 n=1 Tax=Oryzias melastigma TaxID=30732 RepID=A0A834FTN1_ORYME|nr:A disintegrin and metalloproteinase with thrombospondin motifs 2 [Oryzias melastigma]
MGESHGGFLMVLLLLQTGSLHSVYITDSTGSLHQVLSEFDIIHPIRTTSEGNFLSRAVSAHHLHRSKRHVFLSSKTSIPKTILRSNWKDIPPLLEQTPPTRGWSQEIFYNVTVFGQELHLKLHPNTRLFTPTATLEWEESGNVQSEPIRASDCFYTGTVLGLEDSSVAISNCDGLAGMIRTEEDEFFIEPLDQQRPGKEEEEEEEEGGRQHVIYRSSAIIKQPSSVNQTTEDYLRGPLLGSLNFSQMGNSSGAGFRRRRRDTQAELFSIEVLLAVDYSVLLFHGRDHIQKYLLTFMNIVNEIYRDRSLGANINIVLVRIIMLSPTKSQELISVGNAQKSLENICGWSYLQHREQSHAEQHDHTIYLSRQEFGPPGMQGYAPVTGMCRLYRSCVLVLEDGFSSAFVAAHETGHVLGMEHDGDANDCADDVPLGSIMSPRVQASFYRYHWSRCSWMELHKYLHTYDCLRDDPFNHDWPAQPPLPGFQYSLDQQCRSDFGPGYSLCTAYMTHDPCKQLWCSDYNNPFFCKTKKGPPLDGTKCGPGKHCFRGFCMKLTPSLLRQDGAWGPWSAFDSCSRTCGGGVRFRTRRCDNPLPANGGRTCFGNSYEFQLCNQEACEALTDFREDQCKVWNPFFEHGGQKHQWLPYQHPEPEQRCHLYCQSNQTGAVVSMNRMVHDGTRCSYQDSHSVCVRGECEHVGCDGQIASDQEEDRCGVCGGDNSSCKVIKGNFTRSTRKQGYLKILEIPKGARHLLIQEFRGTPHVLSLKNLETGHFFLNNEAELPESRVVIERGVLWEYNNTAEKETVRSLGPLKYGVLLMVRSHGDSKVTVSYKYIIQNHLRSSLDSNLLQEDTIFYEWALKKWSHCSKPCGGGKQYTRFGCRRKADGLMVQRMFCSHISKPRAISRTCNTERCQPPRWVTGDWGECSASCGQTGWRRRLVSCQQKSSRGQQQRSVHSKLCGDEQPESKQTCNRIPCPAVWRTGPWTTCSVSCGNGTQERQVACLNPEGSAGNCSQPEPITWRPCQNPPCKGNQKNSIIQWVQSNPNLLTPQMTSRQRCHGDRSAFCRMEVLSRYCAIPGYRQMCCKSCSDRSSAPSNRSSSPSISTESPPGSSRLWKGTTDTVTSVTQLVTVSSDVITTPTPTVGVHPHPSRGSNPDFVYVEYEDYEASSSDENLSHSIEIPDIPPTSIAAARTMAPHQPFRTNTPLVPPVSSLTVTVSENPVVAAVSTPPVVLSTTTAAKGQPLQNINFTEPEPARSISKKDNNSMNEVWYQVVGVDSRRGAGDQQNSFARQMPLLHERTHNKRIQQLLREKRLRGFVGRLNWTRVNRKP